MPLSLVPRPKDARPEYRDGGVKHPSVTTILGVLDAPGLDRWRVKMALGGVDPYRDSNARDTGTILHAAIAHALMPDEAPRVDTAGYSEQSIAEARAAFTAFKAWRADHDVTPILLEYVMVNKALGYGGTLDFFGLVKCLETCGNYTGADARPEVVDWKSSAAIYPDYFVQTSAYAQLMASTTEYVADGLRIVRFDKTAIQFAGKWMPTPNPPLYVEGIIDTDGSTCVSRRHFSVFESARLVYEIQKEWKRKDTRATKAAPTASPTATE